MAATDREHELRWLGMGCHAAGILVLVSAAGIYHATLRSFAISQEQVNQSEIIELETQRERASGIRSEHEQLTRSLADIEERAERIRQRIPDEPSEAEFLRQITNAANSEGLEIRDYNVGLVSGSITHSQVDVRLACQGNYAAVCGFLEYLAKLPRITTVQRLQVMSNLTDDSYPVEISLWLYFGAKASNKSPNNG